MGDTLSGGVDVDHRGRHVSVTEQFLNGADAVAALQQMSGEGVAKGVAAYRLRDSHFDDGFREGTVKGRPVEGAAGSSLCIDVKVQPGRGEDPLPRPVPGRVRASAEFRFGQGDTAVALGQVGLVAKAHLLEVSAQWVGERRRQDGDAVLGALASPNCDAFGAEVEVHDSEPTALVRPQTRSVEDGRHQSWHAGHRGEKGPAFAVAQNGGLATGCLGARNTAEIG